MDRQRASQPLAGVIFDLGGTLIYPATKDEDCVRHLAAWLQSRGWPAAIEDAVRRTRQWVLRATAETGRQHTAIEGIGRALAQFDRRVDDAFLETAEHVFFEPELAGYRAFPGAIMVLERLRAAGLRVACISNATSHWLIERIVDRMGFRPYVDPVASSAAYGRAKPDAGIFRSVLDRWGEPAQRAAMVGDTLAADIAGGAAAGMRTLYVTMTPNPDNVNHRHIRADAEAASLTEAAEVLLRWARDA
jgi:putative hydrolase of the HAD superfamily